MQTGQLPVSVEVINEQDLEEPIVDIGLTKRMVAVKLGFEGKKIGKRDILEGF